MVSIQFEFQSEYGLFCDAIVLPDDHGMTAAEIEALKTSRFEAWVAHIQESQQIANGE